MYKLFDHQEKALSEIDDFYTHGGNSCLFQAPTGSGKSIVGVEFIKRMRDQNKPIYFVTHSKSLVWQFSEHLTDIGVSHGIISPGAPTLRYRIQVISAASLMSRINMIDEPWGLIFEEAHHSSTTMFTQILKKWPKAHLLGLTATPYRLSGEPLSMYEHMILSPPVKWFIDNYFLADYDYYIPQDFDTTGIHHIAGDFKASEIAERAKEDKTRVGNFVKHYEKHSKGLPGIAFGTGIEDSENIAKLFRESGYNMKSLHSKTEGNIKDLLDDAKNGKLPLIATCNLIGEGVDVKGLTAMLDGRPSESLVIQMQHWGRVLRACYAPGFDLSTVSGRRDAMIAGGKGKAQILDFSSNYLRHGLPDDERTWSLTGAIKEKAASKYKRCPSCQRPVLTFAATCPYCSYEFPKQAAPPEETPERDGELIPIGELKSTDKNEVTIKIAREAHDLKSAIRIGKENGINSQGAWYIWTRVLKKSAHVGGK